MDTILEQCMQEDIALGNPQCMDQVRKWPDSNDHLGNKQPSEQSCMAWQVWVSSGVMCEAVGDEIFNS